MLGRNQRSVRKRVNAESLFEIAHGVAEGRRRQPHSLQNKVSAIDALSRGGQFYVVSGGPFSVA